MRKKASGMPNPKRMFEEAQMVRRVKAYLNNMNIITDEDRSVTYCRVARIQGRTKLLTAGCVKETQIVPSSFKRSHQLPNSLYFSRDLHS